MAKANKVMSKVTSKAGNKGEKVQAFTPPSEPVFLIPFGISIVTERLATNDRDEIQTLLYDANELLSGKIKAALTAWLASEEGKELLPNARVNDVSAIDPLPVDYSTGFEKMIRPKPKAVSAPPATVSPVVAPVAPVEPSKAPKGKPSKAKPEIVKSEKRVSKAPTGKPSKRK